LAHAHDQILDLDGADSVDAPVGYKKGDHVFLTSHAWEYINQGECPRRTAQALQRRGLLEFGDGRNIKSRMPAGVPGESRGYKLRRSILDDVMSELSDMSEDTENNT
jgi:hypothetical protein